MKKLLLAFLLLLFTFGTLFAQYPAKYWVQFKDKENSTFSIDKPEEFLSPRAIQKRERFNIPITEEDLPVNDFYINEILKLDTAMVLFTKSKWLNGITIYSQDSLILGKIKAFPFVIDCEKTITMKEPEFFQETKYTFDNRGEVKNEKIAYDMDYGFGIGQIMLNNAHWLHRLGFLGENMVMMVMDAGFHNADSISYFRVLRQEKRLLGVRNFVEIGVDPFRRASHGTMVLSCIASYVPGKLIGTAPKISVYLAKTEDDRTENKIEEDNWVAGIEWADSLGVDILNSSLGYTKFDDTLQTRTYSDVNGKESRASIAASIAANKGMIVCNSAGNEGNKKWHYIGCPADAENILSVGAVDREGNRAPFSSYGPTADGRVKPDAVAVGYLTQVANPRGKVVFSNGTSFSSPLLAGMTACLWQAFPEKNNFQIMEAIRLSGHNAQTPDESLGYGITDFLKAYNYLKYSDLNNSNDEKATFTPKITQYNFFQHAKKIILEIYAQQKQSIVIQMNFINSNKTIKKEYKLSEGTNSVQIKLPKMKNTYDFIEMTIYGDNAVVFEYLLGIE